MPPPFRQTGPPGLVAGGVAGCCWMLDLTSRRLDARQPAGCEKHRHLTGVHVEMPVLDRFGLIFYWRTNCDCACRTVRCWRQCCATVHGDVAWHKDEKQELDANKCVPVYVNILR